jgi:Cu(I)/Ag(I) efflux system membrane protein CusA/SilA
VIEKIIESSAKNKFIIFLMVFFLSAWGYWSLKKTPLDAIPDLSDVQVIIDTEWPGRSPDIIEDQVTYPIVSNMIAVPGVRVARGYSFFSHSFVYVIFEDGTDIYWARSRVIEYLSKLQGKLPKGVNPIIGPDATSVGWVFQYALVDKSGRHTLAELRSLQDWYLKYSLESVEGVAEVASIGGYVKEYQITIDPNRLTAYNLPLMAVTNTIRNSNRDVGGRVVEFNGREFMVRGKGYIKTLRDIENITVGTNGRGTPILLREIAKVSLGPDMRRGIGELDGEGEAVGGIVVMRYNQNALNIIERVKNKLEELKPSLPEGVQIVTTYDRSDLIHRAINTLKEKLIEESIIVSLVCIIFLFHFRSALVVIIMLPVAILMSFIGMKYLSLTSNIMSLGGIAIAIGAMIDAAIVMIENAHKKLEDAERRKMGDTEKINRVETIVEAAKQVGKPLFFSLLIITVSFMPVFTLEAQEGRLFKPLAFTKTFAMFFASFLSITLVPVLMVLLIRGKISPEAKNPISRLLIFLYNPFVKLALRFRIVTIILAILSIAASVPVFKKLGSEFMPALNEGTIFYMPTTLPGISAQEATRSLQIQDKIIKGFPEVEHVFGKIGKAESATDPAPMEMAETVVLLKPEKDWRKGVTWESLIDEMDAAMGVPGWSNAWTMPIKARIDMLATGIRTPVGIKIFGPNVEILEKLGREIEITLREVKGTRSVFAERASGGYYLDFEVKRDVIARYGLTSDDVNEIVESAIGGMMVTTTVEGRERYPVSVRYLRELRTDVDGLKRVLVPVSMGKFEIRISNFETQMSGGMGNPNQIAQVPLGQLVNISLKEGPGMLKSEDGMLVSYVYVDISGRDVGSYVNEAKKVVESKVKVPAGYNLLWSGQYEYMERAKERLKLVIPLTIVLIFVLLYFNFKSVTESIIVMLSVPFALIGSLWIIYLLGYNLSVAVWVGIIALAGVAAETGVVMIVYLDEAYQERVSTNRMNTIKDLYDAVIEGAVQRVRPKMMTVTAIIAGLLPIMWSYGTGADVMKRIAAPMIGGMITSTILTLVIIPAIYMMWKGKGLKNIGVQSY